MSKSKRFVGFFASCTRALVVRSKTGRFKLFALVLSTLPDKFFQNISAPAMAGCTRTL
jgi:hypothetical protein